MPIVENSNNPIHIDINREALESEALVDNIKIIVKAVFETSTGQEATQAIESMYNKDRFKKSDQLEFSIDQDISEAMGAIFGSKKSDISIDTKESILGSLCDYLGIDFSQLSYLASLTFGSDFLPFYHGSHGNPDDDFGGSPSGGNSAITFDGSPDLSNSTYILVLGNGTLVFPEDTHSI